MLKRIAIVFVAFFSVTLGLWYFLGKPEQPVGAKALKVMSYSSFLNAWGPGPEIAKRFHERTGIRVEYHDAGDAGLMLEKLKLFPSDVVIGLDQFSLSAAKSKQKWKELVHLPSEDGEASKTSVYFARFDYSPMAFIYRAGEVTPPSSLDDLLNPRFKRAIALQDPRTSAPGLQFFFWVLRAKGVEEGFKFLEKLRPNVHSISTGWSSAYGAFTKGQAQIVLSYLTSPVYHWAEEKNRDYQAAVFPEGHPVQSEYAGILEDCVSCADAEKFVQFLLEPEIQAIIMKKNFMLPVRKEAIEGTAFEELPPVKTMDAEIDESLLSRREELFERWQALGL